MKKVCLKIIMNIKNYKMRFNQSIKYKKLSMKKCKNFQNGNLFKVK